MCKHCEDYGLACVITARSQPPKDAKGANPPSSSSNVVSAPVAQKKWHRKHSVALTEPRYSGPTSLSQLVSTVTREWPTRADRVLYRKDTRHGYQKVDGIIGGPFLMLPQVRYPQEQIEREEIEEARLSIETRKDLLRKYQRFNAPIYALLTEQEAEAAVDLDIPDQAISSLSYLGLALLAVSAMCRGTPIETRRALLYHLRSRPQVEFNSSLETIQYLLLVSGNVELLSPDSSNSSGMSLNLTGLLTRMAQDLGLHRRISQLNVSSQHLSLRARIWAACVVQDRWYAMSFGQPCLIHLEDCDAPSPSPYQDDNAGEATFNGTQSKLSEVPAEHVKLCEMVGRLLRLVFTPTGLKNTSIQELETLKADLDRWTLQLPASLRWSERSMKEAEAGAGFLNIMKVGLDFIFYRSALISSHNTSQSPHMSPALVWKDLVRRSAEAIEWIETETGTMVMDCSSVTMYGLIQCCLVQFYAVISGEDPKSLRLARRMLQSWSVSIETLSHGYYDPHEGDEPLPSSTTTTAQMQSSFSKGKKNLTLRTKVYISIAMLAEIAEHHIANPMSSATPPPSTSRNQASTMGAVPLTRSNVGSLPLSLPAASFASTSTPNPLDTASHSIIDQGRSAFVNHQSTVLNGAYLSSINQYLPYPPHQQQQQQQQQHSSHPQPHRQQNHLPPSTAALLPPPASSAYHFPTPPQSVESSLGDIEQIDLITLQRWADELMNNPPSLDVHNYATDQISSAPSILQHPYYQRQF
ncbi:hypothetical protein CBS101457_000849 [Exobasidium rhododendri]|nr:hypothetical protein CBS101457_000849 [Exobasidium rhododendri]